MIHEIKPDYTDKDVCVANILLSAIRDLKHPMLMYDVEKEVVKKALELLILTHEKKREIAALVRCKDCIKERHCRITQYFGGEGYCSYGERKEIK